MSGKRWYWVDYTSRLDSLRESLPIAPGTVRLSNSGTRFIARLTEWREGCLSHEAATARMSTAPWKPVEEQ